MATRPSRNIRDAALQSLVFKHESVDLPTVPLKTIAAKIAAAEAMPPSPTRIGLKIVTRPGQESEASAWIENRGGRLISTGDKVLVAELPPESLSQLENCPGIQRAEASRQFQTRLDEARGAATGYDAAMITHPLTGKDVVVGIVDTGVDWSHPDFRNDDGSTRLELFAFANRPNGASTSVINEFAQGAINAALAGGAAIPQGDPIGHGTHCASIAAGNGRASSNSQFHGVAPKAALVAVRSEPLLDDHIIWGIRRAFDVAGDRPAVITLSLGGHLGPHDGTSAVENVIARESGPGRIVVVAAGNEGGDHIHFRGDLEPGQDLVIPVRVTDPQLVFADVWVPRGDDVDVSIETPDGTRHDPDGTTMNTPFGLFEGHWQEDPVNRDQNLTLFIAQGHPGDVWHIRLHAVSVLQGDVHAWGGTANPSSADLFPGMTADGFSLGMPATEERCIAVASFVSRPHFQEAGGGVIGNGLMAGQLSSFSSHGPSRYGMLKPDVAAPGQFITAALAAASEFATQPRFAPRLHASGKYITIQGTSMATPFIAGIIALLLEREPKLTPEEVQQRLRVTARRDAQTGRVWHPGFGFGKIDVEALLSYQG